MRIDIRHIKSVPLFIEAGIGFSLIYYSSFASKNVSAHYQFEVQICIISKASDFSIGLRYLYYSNSALNGLTLVLILSPYLLLNAFNL
ncbi:acyloxyacyl hydrolase [Pseudoalteromonas atlantica]|uniref:acyloxyacyl hydrolase n=1 Tax=Pseudoalteromonas atlantica TaxID=288 RepID=UPI003735698E